MTGKKEKMRRVRILTISIMLLISASLWGCGGNSKETSKTKEQTADETAVETSTDAAETNDEEVTDEAQQESDEKSEDAAKTNGTSKEAQDLLANVKAPSEFSYEMNSIMGDINTTSKVWVKGEKNRIEGNDTVGGNFVSIFDGESMYVLVPQSKTGTKVTASSDTSQAAEQDSGQNFGNDLISQDWDFLGMEYLGEETLNDVKTLVFEDKTQGYKFWVNKEYGIPMKMEVSSGGSSLTMEVGELKVEEVSDSMFEVPSDYQITEMSY